jgi:type II secretory pathway component PulF
MGVSWLDVVASLLKFEGFTRESLWGKIKRIVTYPMVLIMAILFVIWFVVMMIIVAFKSR